MTSLSEFTPSDFEIKVVGKSGQISLGKRFAGKVLRLDPARGWIDPADRGRARAGEPTLDDRRTRPVSDRARPRLGGGTPAKAAEPESLTAKRPKPAWSNGSFDSPAVLRSFRTRESRLQLSLAPSWTDALRFLLDTNVCVDFLNGRYPKVAKKLLRLPPDAVA